MLDGRHELAMQHFHRLFKQAQHFEMNLNTFFAYNSLLLPTNDEKRKRRFMRCRFLFFFFLVIFRVRS